MPYDILKAYQNGTRDFSGKPGQNYYQNSADYSIKVNFDPIKGILKGTSKIYYRNNSSDSIYYMVFRLYHDIMRKGNIRDEEIDPDILTQGVQIHSLVIENKQYVDNPDVYINRTGTNLIVALPELLLKGEKIQIDISWTTQLPESHLHRFGNYGPSNWFVAYWYPQIAVYDDINGWDQIDYTGTYEFYNDFANFDVEIIVPKNHMIWATGEWENPDEILSSQKLQKLEEVRTTQQQVQLIQSRDWEYNTIFKKSSGRLKYHFIADSVTDFAFAVSGSYFWDAASAITDSLTGKRTVIHAVYPSDAKEFSDIAAYGARAVKHFSAQAIGIPYPYAKATVFNGDGGMEFPMMVNQRAEEGEANHFVTMHELFHAYFPFMTGLNERKYAWLDEGLTSYLPIETESELGGHYFTIEKISQNYSALSGDYEEPVLMEPTNQLKGFSYYHQAYWRSSMAFYVLEEYLGREKFRKVIREFIKRWEGKHPTGYDFIYTLEDVCQEDLEWIIKPWFFENGWIDLGISNASITNNKLLVEISNLKGFPIPFSLLFTLSDGQVMKRNYDIGVWKNNTKKVVIEIEGLLDPRKINIGLENLPDKDLVNNQYFIFNHEPEKIK